MELLSDMRLAPSYAIIKNNRLMRSYHVVKDSVLI